MATIVQRRNHSAIKVATSAKWYMVSVSIPLLLALYIAILAAYALYVILLQADW
jgi:hypothetical protein